MLPKNVVTRALLKTEVYEKSKKATVENRAANVAALPLFLGPCFSSALLGGGGEEHARMA